MADPDDEEVIASLLAPRFRRPSGTEPTEPTERADPTEPTEASEPGEPIELGDSGPAAGTPAPGRIDELPAAREPLTASPEPADVTADAAIAIVGGERFLPVADPVLIRPEEAGPMRIFVPQGTAVHAIEAGRVAEIDEHLAGEVTIRADGDRFFHYRRLLPSSVRVSSGDAVAPGAVIGTVGEAIDDDPPCVVVGLRDGDGNWVDIHAELVGLADPGELGLCVTHEAGEWVDPLARDASS